MSATIQELLQKRFATKVFDPEKKVNEEDLSSILECARLSCSSVNIQPWNILVITNSDLRTRLREASYNQPQITDASHLLVMTTIKDPMPRVQKTASLIEAVAGKENADKYLAMVKGSLRPSPEATLAWLQRQTYLALQAMILGAIERGIDSCPMEGFDVARYTEILRLTEAVPTSVLAIGYAKVPGFPKIRLPLEDIVEYRV